MLIDTHAHLNFPQFKQDTIENILQRALANDVQKIINVGSDLRTSKESIELAQKYNNVFATVGIHPHDAESGLPQMSELENLINSNKVVAIGETGLDFYKNFSPQDKQKIVFEKQLELAIKYQKPIIIHSREADQNTYEILKAWQPAKAVMHCFAGDIGYAKKILDLGYLISFTGNITFPKNIKGQEVASYAPLDRIMLETDCPFLSPEPHRGQTNEPAYIKHIAEKVSSLKKISVTELAEATSRNAIAFFGI